MPGYNHTYCRHNIVGKSQYAMHMQGFRCAIPKDQTFANCQTYTGQHESISQGLWVCYLCVMEEVCLCELSVPLLLSNWISNEKPCWTYSRAKWRTAHLRITSVTRGSGWLMFELCHCFKTLMLHLRPKDSIVWICMHIVNTFINI